MSRYDMTRRNALLGLGSAAAAGLGGVPARAETTTLTVLTHEAMKSAATKGPSGDVTAAWRKANNCDITWITLDVYGIGTRLEREAALSSTSLDVSYVEFTLPRVMQMMEPLDPYLASDPIDGMGPDLADYPANLLASLKVGSSVRGVPVRVSALGPVYNEALFEERGITSVPKTFEEFIEAARRMTFTRPDGTKVYGMVISGTPSQIDGYSGFARAYGSDYMTADNKITANAPGTVKAVELLATLFKEGVLPPQSFTMTPEDLFTWTQQGRVGFGIQPLARLPTLNDPKGTKYAGKLKALDWPMTTDLVGKVPFGAALQVWNLVMPKNAAPARKKLAWSFIQMLSSKEITVAQALNGNGPARISAYSDPRLASIAYMDAMKPAIKYGSPPLPSFPNEIKVNDVFVEETQLAILGRKPAQAAMDEAVTRAKPLV